MTIRLRTAFFLILGVLILWVLYLQREILTPFVLAAIFAFIFNPIVNFFSDHIKLPRTISIIIIYFLIIGVLVLGGVSVSQRVINESSQLQEFISNLIRTASAEVNNLPEWIKPAVKDTLTSLDRTKLIGTSASLLYLFPQAVSGIVSFVIFLFSAFYFLKEGRNIVDRILNFVPRDYRIETEILLRKINSVLGSYLRGQLLIVFFMSSLFFVVLSIFNVKFSLFLAIFSGIAEIVPFIGPFVATSLAGIIAVTSGSSNFNLNPAQTALAVILSYIVVRQIADLFLTPYIMGKITRLHPLLILFAVLAGGKMAGMLGLILAVPIAAVVRILIEFSFDKISDSERKSN